jgi:hypothetical protein
MNLSASKMQSSKPEAKIIDLDWLNEKQVAEMLRCPVSTLRLWRLKKEGPKFFHLGKKLWYHRADVFDFILRCYNTED